MTMEQTLASWLRFSQLRHIDFTVEGLRVNRDLFNEAATAIAQGRVPLTTWQRQSGRDRDYAEYRSESDTLVLPANSHGRIHRFRAMVVHEAVHIHTDMHSVRMDYYSEEAAGYIAQVLFLVRCDRTDDLDFGAPRANAIVGAAHRVITTHHLDTQRGVTLTRDQIAELRQAIHDEPHYRETAQSHPRGGHHDGLIRQAPSSGFTCWGLCE